MRAELIDHMGSDLSVVNAARVSFDKAVEVWDEDESYLVPEGVNRKRYSGEDNARLIRYLARHNHFTPFTHCQITLRETVPIFVARQRFKHSVGFTYNEVSRRYVDDEPSFFFPQVWRLRPEGSVKQGSGEEVDPYTEVYVKEEYRKAVETCQEAYRFLLRQEVAPEQARMVLPQSMATSYYVTGSLFAFARAYLLRKDSDAQVEIQELAHQWDKLIRPLFPVSWSALVDEMV